MTKPKTAASKRKQTPAAPASDSDLLAVLVLDESGSMGWLANDVIESTDEYVAGLAADARETKSETLLSLTAFSSGVNRFRHWHVAEAVENIPSLGGRYRTGGGTALFDAIAHSLEAADEALTKMKRPEMKCLHVTITDGGENSSQDYPADETGSNADLTRMVREYEHLTPHERETLQGRERDEVLDARVASGEKLGNWTFVYLGAGHENVAQAQAFAASAGYTPENAMLYAATAGGTRSSMNSLRAATLTRKTSPDAHSGHFFADAGQSVADYTDPNATAPQATTASSAKIEKRDLGDLLGGGDA